MEIHVPNKGMSLTQKLPTEMYAAGYRFQSSETQMAAISRFVSPEEWRELAEGVNRSIDRHHYRSNTCALAPMFLTLGLCFCPLVYVACNMGTKVNDDMENMRVTKALNSRGIALYWTSTTKVHLGGVTFRISQNTPPLAQKMDR